MPRPTRRTPALAAAVLAGLALASTPALAAPPSAPPAAAPAAAPAAVAVPVPPPPVPPVAQPEAIEDLSGYVPADTCDYTAKPGVLALSRLLQAAYPGTGSDGIVNTCRAEGSTSEHTEGRAFDWAVSVDNPLQAAEAAALLAWLQAPDAQGRPAAMARRLGIMYAIWNKRIWGTYAAGAGWRPYRCTGITGCHMDHVHFSLSWAGARGVTSFWTGRVAATDYGPCLLDGQAFADPRPTANAVPCPSWRPLPLTHPLVARLQADAGTTLAQGASGPAVTDLQRALGGTGVDGTFGPATADLVATFQSRRSLPATGSVGPDTWTALLDAVTGGAATAPTPVTAPPATTPAPAPTPSTPSVSTTPTATTPARSASTTALPLHLGSRGPLVLRLQRALHVPANGVYGPTTYTAVRRAQKAHHLTVDGWVGPMTWRAVHPA